ncbi:MAG TPA: hypothetical protein VL633_09495 [Bacteroidota bacterium]|nr:hypothetical protein [Bacteroidota bacterium]
MNEHLLSRFNGIQRRSMIAGAAASLVLIIGLFVSSRQFFQSYLYAYIFWMGLTLGCLGILLLHHLVSGAWGHLIQRLTESGARMMPVMALLFIPIFFGMHELFPWTRPEVVEANEVVHKKIAYLNVPFFAGRWVFYFAVWSGTAFLLSRWSRLQDNNGDAALTKKMKILSGPALVVFVVTVTLASVDWMMSLEPEWYSTIYGMTTIVGDVLTTLAFCILWLRYLNNDRPFAGIVTTRHSHHLGNLLMAFVILWAYMAFSQFLIIWAGNLPEENVWYLRRLGMGWNIIALMLLIGHFFVPFGLLLSRKTKKVLKALSLIAAGILVMRFVDLFWRIVPAFSGNQLRVHWMDFAAIVAIGGIWLTMFVRDLKSQPLIPLHDPRFVDGQSIYLH